MSSKYASLIHSEPEFHHEFYLIQDNLRFRKLGAWMMLERDEQDRIAKEQAQENMALLELVKRIAREKDMDVETAWDAIQGSLNEDEKRPIIIEYIDEIKRIQNEKLSDQAWRAKFITIFFQTRAQGLFDGVWSYLRDWTMEDSMQLDDKQVAKINVFLTAEQNQEDIDELIALENPELNDFSDGEESGKLGGNSSKKTVPKSSKENLDGMVATPELQQAV
jgi:hypothetical protein